jgi:hypothetical protein
VCDAHQDLSTEDTDGSDRRLLNSMGIEVGEKVVPDDTHLLDAERWRKRAEQARAVAHKKKDDTKLILIALADNFERLAELERTKETTSIGCAQPNTD